MNPSSIRIPLVLAGLVAYPAWAQTPPPLISACYNATNGALRVVTAPSDCRTAERFITWNVQGPTGSRGEQGERGEQGDVGPAGPTSITRRFPPQPTLIYPSSSGESSAQCLPGEKATGGGYHSAPVQGIFPWSVVVNYNYPSSIGGPAPDTWNVGAINNDPSGQTISLTAFILCAAP